jgi:[ribosomal protein S5]-alanine N-acetyltransferase
MTSTLNATRLVLRRWTVDDAPDLYAAFGDPEAMRFWNSPPAAAVEDVADQIRRSLQAHPDHHAAWSIVLRSERKAIGMVNYHHRDVRNRRLEIGFILAQPYWRQGLMEEAIRALLQHCFESLNVHRVEAVIAPPNEASVRLVRRLGFRAEGGPMRDRIYVSDGVWLSVTMFGLLDEDWSVHRPRFAP